MLFQHNYLVQFYQSSKNVVYFNVSEKCQKLRFEKSDAISFTCFPVIEQPKTKKLFRNFVYFLVHIYVKRNVYEFKMLDFKGLYFLNI